MNFSLWASYLIALVSTALSADALQVAPGSPCAHKCLSSPSDNNWAASSSNTNSSEITCFDDQFSSTKVGLKYKQCQECLQTSTRGNWGETDAKWFVYNARFAVDVCLFHTPKASDDNAVSSCSTNQACESLRKGLTYDNLPDTQNTTWNYCFDDDGAFMGSERAKCMQCLRESQNQTYLANFITALEAGCRQTPEKGTAIGLSGTLFTNHVVQITDPSDTSHPDNDKSPGLSTGAIIGIAVAVIILVLTAVSLLFYYCARERESGHWEQDYYDGDAPPNDSIFAARYDMTQARLRAEQQQQQAEAAAKFQYLRYHENNNLAPEKPRTFNTSGDYYDHMERCRPAQGQDQPRGRSAYRMDDLSPTAHKRSSTATLPSHHAVKRDPSSSGTITESRSGSAVVVTRRRLSPPASVHQPVRTNTPDSFAVQAYLDAAAESARMAAVAAATVHPPSMSSMPANSPRSSKRRSMLSMFSLRSGVSSISKKSKMFSASSSSSQQHPPPKYIFQPPLTSDKAFHGDKGISRPILAREEPRFLEAGIAGRPNNNNVTPSRAQQPSSPEDKYAEYGEVPLRSGKSDLYGM